MARVKAQLGKAARLYGRVRGEEIVRLVFLGSPAFALPTLEAVRAAGYEIGLVVTQPDRLAGRGQNSTPTPVAAYARQHALRVWQTPSLKGPQAEARLKEVGAQAMVLAAFAALVPGNLLDLTPGGILNVHPSLLPRWRGAAPIQSALLAGDRETGVSIIRLVQALDAGPILLQERLPIQPHDDFLSLEPRLAALGASLVVRALAERPAPRPQLESGATYSGRIQREHARIDWAHPSVRIWNQVRAYRGWPQAFTTFDGRLLKVLRAWPLPDSEDGHAVSEEQVGTVELAGGTPVVTTGSGRLRLDEVQLEGKRAQSGEAFARGYPGLQGAKLA
ncbi:MAG: methionyl-tRNA formyltransferase [Chloroflexota bacterium]|nr:methionyl-tRNA formyltransferase [Chloroflexota bacterium]